ncbi:MAG TPA: thioredoxin domain-containing protein [Pyrinomonadaceae bacterium]|jgi:protein-disulfide isomerase
MQNLNYSNRLPISEEEIDRNLEESFPASDPPSWSLGTDHGGASGTKTAPEPAPNRGSYLLSRPVGENDHIQGADSAPVTLLMYGAYECPFCVEGNRIVKQIRREFAETLRFAFRHFPLINVHPHAAAAAEVAESAGEQGKFWEMHDKLFENYDRLDGLHLVRYGKSIGLDMRKFHRAITERKFARRVYEDLFSGVESGVKGTPTYFINGVKHFASGEFDALSRAIENAAALSSRIPLKI